MSDCRKVDLLLASQPVPRDTCDECGYKSHLLIDCKNGRMVEDYNVKKPIDNPLKSFSNDQISDEFFRRINSGELSCEYVQHKINEYRN